MILASFSFTETEHGAWLIWILLSSCVSFSIVCISLLMKCWKSWNVNSSRMQLESIKTTDQTVTYSFSTILCDPLLWLFMFACMAWQERRKKRCIKRVWYVPCSYWCQRQAKWRGRCLPHHILSHLHQVLRLRRKQPPDTELLPLFSSYGKIVSPREKDCRQLPFTFFSSLVRCLFLFGTLFHFWSFFFFVFLFFVTPLKWLLFFVFCLCVDPSLQRYYICFDRFE